MCFRFRIVVYQVTRCEIFLISIFFPICRQGLNVFNTAYVLADPKSATDTDYERIESVIGHEYFHNWTGEFSLLPRKK